MHSTTFFTATLASVLAVTGHILNGREEPITVTVTTIPEYCLSNTAPATVMSPIIVQSGSNAVTQSVAVPVTPLSVPSTVEATSASVVPVSQISDGQVQQAATVSLPSVAIASYVNATATSITTAANATVTTSTPTTEAESSVVSTSEAGTSTAPATANTASGKGVGAGFLTVIAAVAGVFVAFA